MIVFCAQFQHCFIEAMVPFLLNTWICCSHGLSAHQLLPQRSLWVDDVLEFCCPFINILEKTVYFTDSLGTEELLVSK